MMDIVSPNQCSFFLSTTLQIMSLSSMNWYTLKNKHGLKGLMIIKVDLEKAYERLDGGFIRETLYDVGLLKLMVETIYMCITSGSFRLLWNGDLTEEVRPSKGVRQGDPISPYIFILYLDILAHLIQFKVAEGLWKPIKTSGDGPLISHLFFANDLLLFVEADTSQVVIIKECLLEFSKASGQKVNFAKSLMYFSPSVEDIQAASLCVMTGIPHTDDLGKYLGVPIIRSRASKDTYSDLLDEFNKKLTGWKGRCLSLAGYVTLAISIFTNLPIYQMHTSFLLVLVVEDIDKRIRFFM